MAYDPNAFGRGLQQSYGFVNGIANDVRQGQQQMQQQNALSAYAQNPNDPNALNALAQADPRTAIQLRQQQAQQQGAQTEERTKLFGRAAKAAKTPQEWDAIATHLSQNGYPEAAQMVGKFNPEIRSAYMAAAGESDASDKPSALIQGYQFRQSLPETERGQFDKYQQNARPQIFGSAEAGYNVFDPNAGQAPAPAAPQDIPRVATPEEAAKLPPGTQFMMPDGRVGTVPGGAGGNASGGFLDPLAPR